MAIYSIAEDRLQSVTETSFAAENMYERRDIQKLLRDQISVLDDRLMVIAEEFGEWVDSSRRIDLLCLDEDANLVVVELKRTDDGGHMDLQSMRYAAMVSNMTFEQLVDTHSRFLKADRATAEAAVLTFLGWETVVEEQFAQDVRIVLAAADFSKEVTTTVMWLNERELDIRCVRLKPYRLESGQLLLDVQQLIPLPEAANFQTQIGVKRRAERHSLTERNSRRIDWWTSLIAQPGAELHSAIKPKNSPYHIARENRLQWSYLLQRHDCGAELFIEMATPERSTDLYDHLLGMSADIEERFGAPLSWEPIGATRGCKVTYMSAGGYRSPDDEWLSIQVRQVEAMRRLRAVLMPHIESWPGR